jgi:hypothetical protein
MRLMLDDGRTVTLSGRVARLVWWLVQHRETLTTPRCCQLQVDMAGGEVQARLTVFHGTLPDPPGGS